MAEQAEIVESLKLRVVALESTNAVLTMDQAEGVEEEEAGQGQEADQEEDAGQVITVALNRVNHWGR